MRLLSDLLLVIRRGSGECKSGTLEALRLARQRSEPIHLLLTDVVMPLMHGRELVNEIRGLIPGIKVIYMSGASPSEVADHGVGLAFGQPYLPKPFTIDALAQKVRATLDYRSPFSKPPH